MVGWQRIRHPDIAAWAAAARPVAEQVLARSEEAWRCGGTWFVGVDALPAYLQHPRVRPVASLAAQDVPLGTLEETAMRAAVEACGGNIARAARKLGISRSTLYRRLGSDPRTAH